MNLVVEDGTGKSTADSYSSLVELEAYHSARGNSAWNAADEADRETAARKAATYLDNIFRGLWKGAKLSRSQALAWPREDVFDEDGLAVDDDAVPDEVKRAHAEASLVALTEDLLPALKRGGRIKRRKVDVIETEYMDDAPAGKSWPQIEAPVAGLLKSDSQLELVRA